MSQWPMVKLGDVAQIISGLTFKKTEVKDQPDSTFNCGVIRATNFHNSTLRLNNLVYAPNSIVKQHQLLSPNDIALIASSGSLTTIGNVAFVDINNQISFGAFLRVIRVKSDKILAKFLFHFLSSNATQKRLKSLSQGANIKNLRQADLLNLKIPLPPLEEQLRIAELLKQSSQQISNARQKLDRLLMISLNTMDAHFTAEAVAGDRGWSQIGDFVISTQYGTSKKANETQGIPVLRMGNITYEGELDLKDLKYVELDELERKKFNLKNGDILFNRTNSPELVGKTTVYDSQSEMTFAGYLVRARTSEDAHPEYISGFLNSSYGKAYLRNQAKSIVGMANINAKEFLKIPIPSANESEQGEFSSLYIHGRSQINLVRKKITLLEELHQSLATRAFAGQL